MFYNTTGWLCHSHLNANVLTCLTQLDKPDLVLHTNLWLAPVLHQARGSRHPPQLPDTSFPVTPDTSDPRLEQRAWCWTQVWKQEGLGELTWITNLSDQTFEWRSLRWRSCFAGRVWWWASSVKRDPEGISGTEEKLSGGCGSLVETVQAY